MTSAHHPMPPNAKEKVLHLYWWPRSFAGLTAYALLVALALGFGSAYWMLRDDHPYPLGRKQTGAWTYWPEIGSPAVDPYALAMINRSARLPLSVGEGLELVAAHDTAGKALRSACAYRVGLTAPQARFWTLTAFTKGEGRPVTTDLGRSGFTSSEIIRNEDGSFSITLDRQARPGNWLQLPTQRNFVLVLRLYDVPATGGRTVIDDQLAPTIELLECQP